MILGVFTLLVVLALAAGICRHQCLLKDRARLMRDAVRHRDFSFRLPTRGLLFGERALQEALNDMGLEIQKLVARDEVEAWQRLARVLTHEIMNATTPIRSITQAYLANPAIRGSLYEEGIQAIYDTSSGLASFVESYRTLTQMQDPVWREVLLEDFCHGIAALYPQLCWKIEVVPAEVIQVDENLLRQVFINMVKNALEAEAKTVGIRYLAPEHVDGRARRPFGRLQLSNDGHVIPDNVAREIFIPFFTTKTTGGGIGLSLSRQMLLMMHLSLSLKERPLEGYNVTFEIEGE